MGGARHAYKVDAEGEQFIRETFEALPDTTLPELSEAYEEVFDVYVSPQTLSDTVRRMGYTKKRGSSDHGRPSERMWSPPETPGGSSSPR
jgi:transposase